MSVMEGARPIEILLVEDNPGDIRLTREALTGGKALNHMTIAEDGERALAILRREGEYACAPRPDIILLDLNLPKKDGREVLDEIKRDEALKSIPVVVLATSPDDRDIAGSYSLHANCYIAKPTDLSQFLDVVKTVEDFWFTIVMLPPRRTG